MPQCLNVGNHMSQLNYVFLIVQTQSVALPHGTVGWSAVCNCGTFVFPDYTHLFCFVLFIYLK